MSKILSLCKLWSHDHDAVQNLVCRVMSGHDKYCLTSKKTSKINSIHEAIKKMLPSYMLVSKCDKKVFDIMTSNVDKITATQDYIGCATAFATFAEKILLSSMNPSQMKFWSDLNNLGIVGNLSVLEVKLPAGIEANHIISIHKVMGFVSTKYGGYILNGAHLYQLYDMSNSLVNARYIAACYRESGLFGLSKDNYKEAYYKFERQIAAKVVNKFPLGNELVAKSIKSGLAMVLNEFHKDKDVDGLSTGVTEQFDKLEEEYNKLNDGGMSWFKFAKEVIVSNRAVVDLMYTFHLLPSPYTNPVGLMDQTLNNMGNEHSFNRRTFDEFMKYVYSFDIAVMELPSCVLLQVPIVELCSKH